MGLETRGRPVDAGVTRRTVVKTGARLAYAAPLVAASFKLSASALAQEALSAATCNGGTCGDLEGCGDDSGKCYCFATDIGGFCHRCQSCDTVKPCSANSDCSPGSICSDNNCCGVSVCMQPCAETAGSPTDDCILIPDPGPDAARVYEVASLGSDRGEVVGVNSRRCGQTVCP